MSPYLPITPKQIADDAVKAYEAGTAVAHVHARNPETGQPTPDLGLFRQIVTEIKQHTKDMIGLKGIDKVEFQIISQSATSRCLVNQASITFFGSTI